MSAQAGVFYFDGRPISPEIVARLADAIDPFGPDGGGERLQSGLAMVSRRWHVTPEDSAAHQPFVSPRGHVMTWDGRLDNREDLLAQLWHDRDDNVSDIALAMKAYERWGADGFGRLIGDWSLVLWDAAAQAVVMASDYLGVRPLHYYLEADAVWWSTTLECLVRTHDLYEALEPRFLVGFMTSARPAGITPYAGVLSVPTGHSLTIARSGVASTRRFWTLQAPEIRYRHPAHYETHLRSVFFDALRARLRSTAPVWAQLSGGLDSSAVVCGADLLVKERLAVAPELCTVSFVTDGSPETDERRFVACVDEQCGCTTHLIQQDNVLDRVEPTRQWISPLQPTFASLNAFDLIRRSGGRLLLTGVGGDASLGDYHDYHWDVARMIQDRRPLRALSLARQRALAAKRSIWDVLRSATQELARPAALIDRLVSETLVNCGGALPVTDAHICDTFLLLPAYASFWRDEWARQCAYGLDVPDISKRPPASQIMAMATHRLGQSPSELPGAMLSHPLLDRRLVEFMMGVPIQVIAPPGTSRGLMRQAFAPFMPARIVARFSKNSARSFYMRNTRDVLLRWIDHPEQVTLLELGFLDRDRVMAYLCKLRDAGKHAEQFILMARLEQWLVSRAEYFRDSRKPMAVPQRVHVAS
jgi:asparagine synthase (glutamine-hydrolysing)